MDFLKAWGIGILAALGVPLLVIGIALFLAMGMFALIGWIGVLFAVCNGDWWQAFVLLIVWAICAGMLSALEVNS